MLQSGLPISKSGLPIYPQTAPKTAQYPAEREFHSTCVTKRQLRRVRVPSRECVLACFGGLDKLEPLELLDILGNLEFIPLSLFLVSYRECASERKGRILFVFSCVNHCREE